MSHGETYAATSLEEYVVHLPKPGELRSRQDHRRQLLRGVGYLILVGSPRRARRIAELAHARFGARHGAELSCYSDLTVPGCDESGREFAVYVAELPGDKKGPGPKVGVVSHGIGQAGVEIVLSELPALLALADGGRAPKLRGVIRCGTRGTLSRVPLEAIALSTSCYDDRLEKMLPSQAGSSA